MSVKLEAGQWYRNRAKFIRYVVGVGPLMGKPKEDRYPFLVIGDAAGSDIFWCSEDGKCYDDESKEDLVEHLPCCDGFDWEPPKPEPRCCPFLNGDEFAPHRDKWIYHVGRPDLWRVERYNNDYVFINGRQVAYCDLYDNYRFEDKTQCGVLVEG